MQIEYFFITLESSTSSIMIGYIFVSSQCYDVLLCI